jgi:Ca-activated chloride channel family protein
MTRINPDDPKWTAYVLGELDETERAAVELELESSEEARTLVDDLRFAADLTRTELREGLAVAPLTFQERQKIHAAANTLQPRRWFGARPAVWRTGLVAASIAVIVVTVALMPALLRSPSGPSAPPPATMAEARKAEEPALPAAKDQAKPDAQFGLRYEHPATPVPRAVPMPPVSVFPVPAPQVSVPATGRVFGTVQDATAARMPGVAIVATNTQNGAAATTVTNEAGAYTLDGLQPGTYRVTSSLPGFQTSVDSIQVGSNAQAQRDITLQVGQVTQTVQVTVDAPTLNTSTSVSAGEPFRVERERGVGFGVGPDLGGALGGQIRQQAFATPPPPPSAASRAPGVPPAFDRIAPRPYNNAEAYDAINDNPFLTVAQNPLSTFSIDVDTASYSNVRRYLNQNQLPPRDAVRIEEMINYFAYDYPQPSGSNPIGAAIEAASAPWNPQHRLVRVGIKARDLDARRRPPSNLVFLIDVSGSMQPAERLPLLKDGIRMLVEQLTANDHVTVVTYAGTTGVALRSTRGDQKDVILNLIDSLQAGGATNGGSGIQLAYEQAVANFIPGGVNRVILATDGDFNVGITDRSALLRLIEDKAKTGVFLSVLGVGMGNYKDATLETLADKGHGNYAYLDTLNEARKVLVDQMSGTLVTVAKDVKVQVEFNPAVVDAYRLIGYENRALRNENFNNDLKDAGDMGAGHTVTVLYEVVPRGVAINAPGTDPLKYQQQPAPPPAGNTSNETLTVKIRYKEPTASDSKLLVFPLVDREQAFARSSVDFRFAAGVASFGMIMRGSPYRGTATIESVLSIAEDSLGSDRNGYRREFLQLVQRARRIPAAERR